MKTYCLGNLGTLCLFLLASSTAAAEPPEDEIFRPLDVFQLEHASDPRISPDGKRIVYVRNSMDIMKDRRRSNLWIINSDGTENRPLTSGKQNDSSPRWSPDGKRLLYVSASGDTVANSLPLDGHRADGQAYGCYLRPDERCLVAGRHADRFHHDGPGAV